MTSNKQDWSYLAALYDGEGCFHVCKQLQTRGFNYGYRLDMPIAMTSIKTMRWLIRNFGGVFYVKGKDKRYANAKQMYSWGPRGKANKEILLLGILPYLIEKKEQAEVALAFLRTEWNTPAEKDTLYMKLRILKRESVETNTSDSELDFSEKIESELAGDCESELAVTQVA